MNNDSSTPQTAAPEKEKAPATTYSTIPAKDAVTTVPPATAAKGNDEVMSTPAKKS